MPTGIQLSSGVVVGQPIPLDAKFGPYNSTTDALADIGVGLRYRGLTVGVYVSGDLDPGQSGQGPPDPVLKEYWFKDGTANGDFVAKSSDVTWDSVLSKPATFTPSTHSHPAAQITDFATAVAAVAPPTTNAGLLTSGTLLDARLSTTVTTSLGKADTASQPGHTHTIANVTNLQTTLDGKQASGSYSTTSHVHSSATTTVAGFLSTADKTKLDGVAAGAEVNVNADWTASTGDEAILNKPSTFAPSAHVHAISDVTNLQTTLDGKQASGSYSTTSHVHSAATTTVAGFLSTVDKTKLDGIAAGAEVNVNADWTASTGDAAILNKPSTFAPSAHGHAISDVTNLQTTLDGKQASGSYSTTSHAHSSATTTIAGFLSTADKTKLDGIAAGAEVNVNADWTASTGDAAILNKPSTFTPSSHVHAISDVTNLQTTLDGKQASGSYAASSHVHPIATTSAAGFLSSSDHLKLLTIQTGAEVNVNADWTASTGDAAILNKPVLNGVITDAFPSGFGNGVANINWAAASYWSGSLGMTAGTTIAFQNVIVGKTITLDIGNSAGYLLQWPVGITWIGGSAATSALGAVVTSIRVQVLALSATQFIAFSLVPFTDKPSTATSPGIQGQLAWGYDDGAERLYICVANNIWRRATIATWS